MKPNRNRSLSILFFVLFLIAFVFVWRYSTEGVPTVKDWCKLLILESLIQTSLHYSNKVSKKKRKIKVYVDK